MCQRSVVIQLQKMEPQLHNLDQALMFKIELVETHTLRTTGQVQAEDQVTLNDARAITGKDTN